MTTHVADSTDHNMSLMEQQQKVERSPGRIQHSTEERTANRIVDNTEWRIVDRIYGSSLLEATDRRIVTGKRLG